MQASQCPIILAAVPGTVVSVTVDTKLVSPSLHISLSYQTHSQITTSNGNRADVEDSQKRTAK